MTLTPTDEARLRELLAKATPGPFDNRCGLIRAIRGDFAVPLFEAREIWGDPDDPAPTVRDGDGKVLFWYGSQGARVSHGIKKQRANAEALLALLEAAPALLDQITTLRTERDAVLKECSDWARQAGEATGRLEMSEAAGIVDEWRERAEKAERERDALREVCDRSGIEGQRS